MNRKLQAALAAGGIALATHAAAQVTFYEREGFQGRAMTTNDRIGNLERYGFNDRASSVVVERGRWLACEHARFEGRCVVLRRGSYPSLREVGMNNAISSVRRLEPGQEARWEMLPPVAAEPRYEPRHEPQRGVYAPPPVAAVPRPAYYDVPVSSVRVVSGPPSQRCWTERQQGVQPATSEPNIGGALLGGIVGGVLGHQVGGGTGKDLATIGGAVAGAAVGANVNRGSDPGYVERDVQRCQAVSDVKPAYWDVTYVWRGVQHRVQLANDPGSMIRVNEDGAPVVAAR